MTGSANTNWERLATCSVEEVIAWAESQSWARAMSECVQDSVWHAEGDVWRHTKMVCAQLPRLETWSELDADRQRILLWVALLHDSAKPSTIQIDPETQRVTTPKHSLRGEHLARRVLRELGCPLATREQIAKLVRYHGRPVFLLERDRPEHEVIHLSWFLENRLLHLFAVADARGRTTATTDRDVETLHLWRAIAEEQHCLATPYPFRNDTARLWFAQGRLSYPEAEPHEEFSCRVTMLAGPPGSGKDDWAARHRSEAVMVSLDDLRAEMKVDPTDNQGQVVQAANERCRELLRAGTDFVFNATNLLHQTRRRWIELFHDYRAHVEIIYLEPPLSRLKRQNRNRPDAVPESVLNRMLDRCEPPTPYEAESVRLIQ